MTDSIAIVTGSGGDIGAAIAERLAERHIIGVVDIDQAAAEATAEALRSAGNRAEAIICDITDDASIAEMANRARALGPVRVLVNNAGAARDLTLHALQSGNMRADIALNLEGAISMFKALESELIQEGVVINIASVNGFGVYGHPAYSAAKAGLIHFTRMLAVEYGRHGLRANTVAPGTVRTQAWSERAAENPQVFEDAARWYPLRRFADLEDVAEAVAFLAGPGAKSISGVCLPVDCGLSAGSPALPGTFTQSDDFLGDPE